MGQMTLVTGGAGFIGSHLVDRLLADGHRVTVVDDFSNGRRSNLETASSNSNLSIIDADVADYDKIAPLFDGVDWVFHLAGLADIVPSIQHPMKYHHANVDGTVAVLEASRNAKVGRFVYAASSSCYGLPDSYPTPESADIKPMYPYALSKHLGEECVLHWGQVYDIPCLSLRLFNVYGPRSRTTGAYGAVFGVFLAQKLASKPFTVVGDGTQTRDFTFVTDVVDAFVRAADSSIQNEVVNVGAGAPQSINRLVCLLGGDVVNIPKRPGEPDCTFADTSKISKLLGWTPQVSFEDGVQRMLNELDRWRDAPVWDESTIVEATREWFAHLGNNRPAKQTESSEPTFREKV